VNIICTVLHSCIAAYMDMSGGCSTNARCTFQTDSPGASQFSHREVKTATIRRNSFSLGTSENARRNAPRSSTLSRWREHDKRAAVTTLRRAVVLTRVWCPAAFDEMLRTPQNRRLLHPQPPQLYSNTFRQLCTVFNRLCRLMASPHALLDRTKDDRSNDVTDASFYYTDMFMNERL
jgi:hypothetical protein